MMAEEPDNSNNGNSAFMTPVNKRKRGSLTAMSDAKRQATLNDEGDTMVNEGVGHNNAVQPVGDNNTGDNSNAMIAGLGSGDSNTDAGNNSLGVLSTPVTHKTSEEGAPQVTVRKNLPVINEDEQIQIRTTDEFEEAATPSVSNIMNSNNAQNLGVLPSPLPPLTPGMQAVATGPYKTLKRPSFSDVWSTIHPNEMFSLADGMVAIAQQQQHNLQQQLAAANASSLLNMQMAPLPSMFPYGLPGIGPQFAGTMPITTSQQTPLSTTQPLQHQQHQQLSQLPLSLQPQTTGSQIMGQMNPQTQLELLQLQQQQLQHHQQQQQQIAVNENYVAKATSSTPLTSLTGSSTRLIPNPVSTHGRKSDEGEFSKKSKRLEKNRLAAQECRRKKKEYLQCLEERVKLLEVQNDRLIAELKKAKLAGYVESQPSTLLSIPPIPANLADQASNKQDANGNDELDGDGDD